MVKKIVIWSVVIFFGGAVIYFKMNYTMFSINAEGMVPSIQIGKRIVIDKNIYKNPSDVKRGDIVAFQRTIKDAGNNLESYAGNTYVYIWRVVGIAGDSIAVDGGNLTVNGETATYQEANCKSGMSSKFKCMEENIGGKTYLIAFELKEEISPKMSDAGTTVANGQFYFLGDCRNCALDSRDHGPIGFEDLIGKAVYIQE